MVSEHHKHPKMATSSFLLGEVTASLCFGQANVFHELNTSSVDLLASGFFLSLHRHSCRLHVRFPDSAFPSSTCSGLHGYAARKALAGSHQSFKTSPKSTCVDRRAPTTFLNLPILTDVGEILVGIISCSSREKFDFLFDFVSQPLIHGSSGVFPLISVSDGSEQLSSMSIPNVW